jgi:hypothetical protein
MQSRSIVQKQSRPKARITSPTCGQYPCILWRRWAINGGSLYLQFVRKAGRGWKHCEGLAICGFLSSIHCQIYRGNGLVVTRAASCRDWVHHVLQHHTSNKIFGKHMGTLEMFSQMMLMTSIMHRKLEIDCNGNDPEYPLWTNRAMVLMVNFYSTVGVMIAWAPFSRIRTSLRLFFWQEAFFRYYKIIYRIRASATPGGGLDTYVLVL